MSAALIVLPAASPFSAVTSSRNEQTVLVHEPSLLSVVVLTVHVVAFEVWWCLPVQP